MAQVWEASTAGKKRFQYDHVPVALTFDSHVWKIYPKFPEVQIDRDDVMRCLLKGERRHQMLDAMQTQMEETRDEWNRVVLTKSPTKMYNVMRRSLRQVSEEVFPKTFQKMMYNKETKSSD